MELYQIRTFVMVAEEGNLTRAAKRLHTSQPAISAQIKALEDELGLPLFLRTPKGMMLTEDGVRLRERAGHILDSVANLEREAEEMRGVLRGELRIGINAEPDILRIAELFAAMQEKHPQLHIHLLQAMSGEVLQKLESGELDGGFMFGEVSSEKLHRTQLASLDMVIGAAPHLQEFLDQASPDELASQPWIMTPDDCPFHLVAADFFDRHTIAPKQAALVDDESTIRAMVQSGIGLSFLLKTDALGRVPSERLAIWEKEELPLPLSVTSLKRRQNEQIIQTLHAVLVEIWK